MNKKCIKTKKQAVDFMVNALLKTSKEYNIPNITQREYFSLSEVTEFFMRKWGLTFSNLKKEADMPTNIKGKKSSSDIVKTSSVYNCNKFYYHKPKYTGRIPNCLKCSQPFKQSTHNWGVCPDCFLENQMEDSEDNFSICS